MVKARFEFSEQEHSEDFAEFLKNWELLDKWQKCGETCWEGALSRLELKGRYVTMLGFKLEESAPGRWICNLGLPAGEFLRVSVWNLGRWELIYSVSPTSGSVIIREVDVECFHDAVTKLGYLRPSAANGVHGPYSEIWLVRCEDCSEELEESIPKD